MKDTNPIRYYFENLPVWDGQDYIKQLCNHIYVEEDYVLKTKQQ